MNRTKLIVFILLMLFVGNIYSENIQDNEIILKIIIPLDNKEDTDFGHTTIEYSLAKSGFSYNVRNVYSWARQGSHKKQLNEIELKEAIDLISKLSHMQYKGEKEYSVIVKIINQNKETIEVYNQNSLPKELERIFDLLGGIRFEIKDKFKFNL